MDRIYKFEYVPVGGRSAIVRYIDLDQIVAIGMFMSEDLIGVQIDCKYRDAPLVIEILTEQEQLSSEMERVAAEVAALVAAWSIRRNNKVG